MVGCIFHFGRKLPSWWYIFPKGINGGSIKLAHRWAGGAVSTNLGTFGPGGHIDKVPYRGNSSGRSLLGQKHQRGVTKMFGGKERKGEFLGKPGVYNIFRQGNLLEEISMRETPNFFVEERLWKLIIVCGQDII